MFQKGASQVTTHLGLLLEDILISNGLADDLDLLHLSQATLLHLELGRHSLRGSGTRKLGCYNPLPRTIKNENY